MLPVSHFFELALQALQRNRLQTLLAMLGVTVGVGALVTSMALGRGAQDSISEQLRAAGANMIVVNAGNYAVQRPESAEGAPGHEAGLQRIDPNNVPVRHAADERHPGVRSALWYSSDERARWNDFAQLPQHPRRLPSPRVRVHFEDDPNAVHDHPTAKERLGDAMAGLGSAATLTMEDAEAIRKEISGIQYVSSGVHENARISVLGGNAANQQGGKQWFTRLHGTESELPEIRRGWTFTHGEFMSPQQVRQAAQVMVLGRVVADKLFGADANPVGEKVKLWNQTFEVIGVVGSRSWATQPAPGDDQFDAVYVPVTTVHKLLNLSKLNTITVTTQSAGDTTLITNKLIALLRDRHGITEQMSDDFTVKSQAQQLLGKGLPPDLARIVAGNMASVDTLTIEQLSSSLNRANWTMLALLGGVAAVSLLVGGIGVMNVLLLAVTQRTGEVGLRIALGARRSDVATQFVFEAVMLSVMGGLLGALLGVFASASLEQVFNWSATVSPMLIVLAVVVAALLGVASGLYPANRAARLDPIQALHHE